MNLTREAGARSLNAQERAQLTLVNVSNSNRHRKRTEMLLRNTGDHFNRTQSKNDDTISDLSFHLQLMEENIPDLNDYVSIAT